MEKFKYNFIAQADSNTADIYIYGVIGWDVKSENVVKDIANFKGDTLNVHINSVGGQCHEGSAIFNAIKSFNGTKKAIIDGMAGSCASYIMLACDTIEAQENATIFIHNPLIEYAQGNKKALSKIISQLEKIEQTYVQAYMSKTGKDEQEIRIAMDDEATFTAQEAKDFGLIDNVITISENTDSIKAEKGFYRFVAQYFSQNQQSFEVQKSQEQNQQKGKTEMEITDTESLIAVLTSLKDLNDVEAINAEIDNIIGAVENLEIKVKEAETETEPKEEKPEEDYQAKIDQAIAKATADITAQTEAKINGILLAQKTATEPKKKLTGFEATKSAYLNKFINK